jgi:hypothetical protein
MAGLKSPKIASAPARRAGSLPIAGQFRLLPRG